jgi:hypothetical protein
MESEKRFGLWSNVEKSWALDSTGRLLSYGTLAEARAHMRHTPLAHCALPDRVAAEIGEHGDPIFPQGEQLGHTAWTRKRSQETPY